MTDKIQVRRSDYLSTIATTTPKGEIGASKKIKDSKLSGMCVGLSSPACVDIR